ncbi:hypothetical protein MTBBW1_1260002 [Desulfamplus magnetovallimortis]|uniref:Uncharacterized protein n=1 Tax=Desulfamplus magnetovallimortis TaxID=1246637 RepID=A0A1W1H6G8_9BACT|nr:hypothetical protein MTBBW1_1260002 [Desulfamplus magnetovallimortis]
MGDGLNNVMVNLKTGVNHAQSLLLLTREWVVCFGSNYQGYHTDNITDKERILMDKKQEAFMFEFTLNEKE